MDEIDSKETFHYMANPDTRTKHVTHTEVNQNK